MVFRLFVFLMFANVMVAATKAQAGQQDDFLQVDRQVAPGVIQPYQASGDLASSKDCVRRVVSLMASYLLNRVTAVQNVQAEGMASQRDDSRAAVAEVKAAVKSDIQFLLDGAYAVEVEKGGAILHFTYDF